MTEADPVGVADDVKRASIDSYVTARSALDEVLLALPAEAPCGGWTVVEIAAHVAAWERRAATLIPSLAEGAAAPRMDVDAFNAAAAAAARSVPASETLAAYAESRAILLVALAGAPAASFGEAAMVQQVEMERGHCLEHAAELRALVLGPDRAVP
ncbi:MAG TPA: maleylpyruvate isomerase N-terminal domain-containing protein [Candidatus Limnocylindrales bacterium]|jgi:Mycothiol maleylpyruvate isomerase N-terminal domain.|nr:maleylpyruvate isomerase N-terminal domain-containing protein [Candidatus Limnocylindrales bacterium]